MAKSNWMAAETITSPRERLDEDEISLAIRRGEIHGAELKQAQLRAEISRLKTPDPELPEGCARVIKECEIFDFRSARTFTAGVGAILYPPSVHFPAHPPPGHRFLVSSSTFKRLLAQGAIRQ